MAKSGSILLIVGAVVLALAVATVCIVSFKNKEEVTYTVTFNSNGGSIVPEQIVEKGNKAKKPNAPSREGYTFTSWLLNEENYDFNSIVDKNITLKASWKENIPEKEKVTVKFNTDGGTAVASEVIEKGSKIAKPSNPTKDGYTFVEWQLSGLKYDFEAQINQNLELVAKWEKNKTTDKPSTNKPENNNSGSNNTGTTTPTVKKYTVTFNSDGGSAVSSQTVEQGKKVSQPSNPTRAGYTFAGWALNGNTYDFNSAVNGNITLVAKWNENVKATYTVTFNSDGGSAVSSQTITEGGNATKPSNPTRAGYNFGGWTLNGNAYDFNSKVTGNITLVAGWTQKSYTVRVLSVDQYSPDRTLTVYEDGNPISVSAIKYNGVTLCSGGNMTVNMYEISGISSVTVVLANGTSVTASVQ